MDDGLERTAVNFATEKPGVVLNGDNPSVGFSRVRGSSLLDLECFGACDR